MKAPRFTTAALDWTGAVRLPVTGEGHPLRSRYRQALHRALAVAVSAHVGAFGLFAVMGTLRSEVPSPERAVIIIPNMVPPPSLRTDPEPPSLSGDAIPVTPPKIGVPEPVIDSRIVDWECPTNDEMSRLIPSFDPAASGWQEGDSIEIEVPIANPSSDPDPGDFEAVEEMPSLITLPAPEYPEIARQAGVEGTVMVRALVGKDGKVQKAFVTSSIPMLDEAAVASVLRAVFKPALQQHRPVAVWVQVPMRFSLQ